MNSDDVNKAIRDRYGLETEEEEENKECPFYGVENEPEYNDCGNCGRPLSLQQKTRREEKQRVLERLKELEEKGVLEALRRLEET